jgi:predicted enzyme related to lactoylglutathione lyase
VSGVRTRLSGPVLDCGDAIALAEFWATLLGWSVVDSASDPTLGTWALVKSPDGAQKIELQGLLDYRPPVWPNADGEQQMMMHLDVAVEDLDAAVTWVESLGGRVAAHQPRPGNRVMLDPAGHPFCLFVGKVDL